MRYLTLSILFFYSCNSVSDTTPALGMESLYFTAIETNDVQLEVAKKGEWRYEHDEPLQTFEKYMAQHPTLLSDSQKVIYLKPIGEFTQLQQEVLTLTREYLSIFFQTKTVLLEASTDNLVPAWAKRMRDGGNLQLLAPYVLDSMLRGQSPADAIAYMAFTAKDLYPQNSWNYVFGLASHSKRIGVSSIYRFQNKLQDSANFVLFLKRLINVSSHEIGHMFTIGHCTFARCVMNGANSLYETDHTPNRLCSECNKKLSWNIKFNNKKRLAELCNFLKTNKLTKDYLLLQADLQTVEKSSL